MESIWERIFSTGLLVEKYYTPILCLIGILGNTLSLLVFVMDTRYRSQSSSYYLSALAVSDTGFLVSLFVVWLETTVGNVITHPFVCPLIMYIGQVTCFVTVYLTVAYSVQRYVVVYYPLARVHHCTKRKAKITICVIVALALLTFSYVWIIAEVIEIDLSTGFLDVCSVSERYYDISEIANYVDTTITLIVPFFIIAYFNLKTAIKVCELMRQRRLMMAASLLYNTANISAIEDKRMKTVQKKYIQKNFEYLDARVTKTLLLVSCVFLGLNLPLHVIRCAQFIQIARDTDVGVEILQGLQPWANMLFNSNFAVNMVLYCVFGRNFRNSLRNLLCPPNRI